MGLFGVGKVKIINETRNDRIEHILDCTKVKDPMIVGIRALQEFSKNKKVYLFLDSNFSYERNKDILGKNIENICDKFDEAGILYENRNRMVDQTMSLMGLPMKSKKVREYKVAVCLPIEEIEIAAYIFPRQSFFTYIFEEDQKLEDIYKMHDRIHTQENDYSDLLRSGELQVFTYYDTYFKRIRIATECETDIRMIQRIIEESYEV